MVRLCYVVMQAWVARYLQDETTATAELLTLLVQVQCKACLVRQPAIQAFVAATQRGLC